MDFAIELEGAEQKLGDMSRIDALRGRLDGVTTNQGSIRVDGNSVDLESEVADIADTEMHYMVLTDMTARYFSNLKNVIKEGK
jgi:flagellar basal-body rod protein FlgB